MKVATIAAGSLGLVILTLPACSRAGGERAGTALEGLPVKTASVLVEERSVPIRTSGRLASKAEVTLSFKAAGVVARIVVDEGAQVRRGQVLARLELAEIDAQVAQARSVLAQTESDLQRMERLFRDSVVTRSQLEAARTEFDVAKAQVEIAEFNRRYAVITAPDDGRVLRRSAEEGELVSPGRPVLRLGVATRGWVIRLGVADRDVVRLTLGDSAAVRFDAHPGTAFTGRVTEIADAAEPTTGTFEVEVELEDPSQLLKSGFIGQVDIYPAEVQSYAIIPVEALVTGDGEDGVVYALMPGSHSVERRLLKVAAITETGLLVASGLEGVARVVTEGSAYLEPGAIVRDVGDESRSGESNTLPLGRDLPAAADPVRDNP